MLHIIQTLDDPLIRLVADDPVRPEIPAEFRVGPHTEIFCRMSEDKTSVDAMVCCAYRDSVPIDVFELSKDPQDACVAVFYTIWSYKPGAGRKLIIEARKWIEDNRDNIVQFVTLSPPTEMARVFHLRNGASVLRINPDSVNYLYP